MRYKALVLLSVLVFTRLYSQEVVVPKAGYGGGIGLTFGIYLPAMGDSVPKSIEAIFGVPMKEYPLMLNTGLAAYIYIREVFRLGVASFGSLTRVGKTAAPVPGEEELYHHTVDVALRYDFFCMAFTRLLRNMEVSGELAVGTGHASLRLMRLRVLPTWEEICEHDTLAWGRGFASELSTTFPIIRLTFGIMLPVTEWFKLAINVGGLYAKVPPKTWYLHEGKYLIADSKGLDLTGFYFEVSPRLDNRPLWW